MPEFLFSNFGQSTLQGNIAAANLWLEIEPSAASRFPVPVAGQVFAVVLADGVNEPEICWVTDNPLNGLLRVLRAQEGTPSQFWKAGTSVLHTHTAASLEWFVTGGQIIWKAELEAQLAALAASIAAVDAKVNANTAADTAQGTLLTHQIEQNSATLIENYSVVTDFFLAQTTINQALTATVSSTEASVTNFLLAQANNNAATAQHLVTLDANFGAVQALAQQNTQAIAATDQALATAQTDLNAKYNGHTAQITALTSALANDYNALSTVQTTLQASFNAQTATVTTLSLAQAGLDGRLSATYGVKVGAGNAFAGFTLLASSGTPTSISQMIFELDRFVIKAPGGSTWFPFVFDVPTGTAFLQAIVVDGAYIRDLTVSTIKILGSAITTPKIAQDHVTIAAVYDTGPGIVISSSPVVIATFSPTLVGGRARIETAIGIAAGGSATSLGFELYRNGVLVDGWNGYAPSGYVNYPVDDFNGPGTAVYEIVAFKSGGPDVTAARVKAAVTDYKTES